MKARFRLTAPSKRRELVAVVLAGLQESDRLRAKLIHTYPHRSVSEKMAEALILAEKGQPLLWRPDEHRRTRLQRVVSNAHDQFDREHKWSDYYDHDKAALDVVDAVIRSEIIA